MKTHQPVAFEAEPSALEALLRAEREVGERLAAADRAVRDIDAAAADDVKRVESDAATALAAHLARLSDEVHTNAVAEAERQYARATRQAAALDALDDAAIRALADEMAGSFVAPLLAPSEPSA